MPTLMESVAQSLNGPALEQISSTLGTDQSTTMSAISAALPMLVAALARNASQPDGADALAGALEQHDGSALDDVLGGLLGGGGGAQSSGGLGSMIGGAILGHIFGQRAPQVGSQLGAQTGLDAGRMMQLLQILAPLVMAALGKAQREQGLDSGGLSDLLRGEHAQVHQAAPGLGGLLTSILDGNHDGSMLDDAERLGGDLLGGFFKRSS